MDFRKLGSYKIRKRINKVNYELKLLIDRGRTVYPIFYIFLLERADQIIPKIIKGIVEEGQDEYKVKKILDQDKQGHYFIN